MALKQIKDSNSDLKEFQEALKEVSTLGINQQQEDVKKLVKYEEELKKKSAQKIIASKYKLEKEAQDKVNKETLDVYKEILSLSKEEQEDRLAALGIQSAMYKQWLDEAQKRLDEAAEKLKKETQEAARQKQKEQAKDNLYNLFGQGTEQAGGLQGFLTSSFTQGLSGVFDSVIKTYADYQARINTRLLGANEKTFGSIMNSINIASPFYKTESYIQNVNRLVEAGISQNIEQRAFLETIKDELVTTFDTTNKTLTRLVRIQNDDSTAARMGMEGFLNNFLNQTFSTTEYLTDVFDSTTGYLEQATAMMTASTSTALEYTIQKWLGSLYSVGMSASSVNAIAQAVGQLASGDISVLGSGMGNLLAMASGGDLATYFKEGLTEATANVLMSSLVSYLGDLNAYDTNIVKTQLAETFGVTAADIKAAANLANLDLASISSSTLSYLQGEDYLGYLMTGASGRIGPATFMSNFLSNLKFNLGKGIAESPALYGLYEAGKLVSELGKFSTTASAIGGALTLASVGAGGIASIINTFKGGGSLTGSLLSEYNQLASKSLKSVSYGVGLSGTGVSESGYIKTSGGTADTIDNGLAGGIQETKELSKTIGVSTEDDIEIVVPKIYKYLTGVFDSKLDTLIKLNSIQSNYSVIDTTGANITNVMSAIMGGTSVNVVANEEEDTNTQLVNTISENVVNIYSLLDSVVKGEQWFSVKDINAAATMPTTIGTAVSGITNYLRTI